MSAMDISVTIMIYVPLICLYLGVLDRRKAWAGTSITEIIGGVLVMTVDHDVPKAAVWYIFAGYSAYRWWKNRRKGGWKKAARQLGAKSKAVIDAMVRQITPSPIPSPAGA